MKTRKITSIIAVNILCLPLFLLVSESETYPALGQLIGVAWMGVLYLIGRTRWGKRALSDTMSVVERLERKKV